MSEKAVYRITYYIICIYIYIYILYHYRNQLKSYDIKNHYNNCRSHLESQDEAWVRYYRAAVTAPADDSTVGSVLGAFSATVAPEDMAQVGRAKTIEKSSVSPVFSKLMSFE